MVDPAALLRAVAFAAERHRRQRRKDAEASPYINHPIAVAAVLADAGHVVDEALLVAAVLHDTVEDTETRLDEIAAYFGATVADLVREVSDDKSLPKERRKLIQIEHAASGSARAKQLKIADKICNLRDIAASRPEGWSVTRCREYVDWAQAVVTGCRDVNRALDRTFDEAVAQAQKALAADE
jgi:GTP diphosphokinase / guanosine-3',5'-bis(diphosphate) 3'-diphosphatase